MLESFTVAFFRKKKKNYSCFVQTLPIPKKMIMITIILNGKNPKFKITPSPKSNTQKKNGKRKKEGTWEQPQLWLQNTKNA